MKRRTGRAERGVEAVEPVADADCRVAPTTIIEYYTQKQSEASQNVQPRRGMRDGPVDPATPTKSSVEIKVKKEQRVPVDGAAGLLVARPAGPGLLGGILAPVVPEGVVTVKVSIITSISHKRTRFRRWATHLRLLITAN